MTHTVTRTKLLGFTFALALLTLVALKLALPSKAAPGGGLPAKVSAATFTVTNGTAKYTGPGSLRFAVQQANANPGPDTIIIDPSVTRIGEQTDGPEFGPDRGSIVITDSVEIIGHGSATLTIDDDYSFIVGRTINPGGTPCGTPGARPPYTTATYLFAIQPSSPNVVVTFQGFSLENSGGFLVTQLGQATARLIDIVLRNGSAANRSTGCDGRFIVHGGNLEIIDSRLENFGTNGASAISNSGGSLRIVRSLLRGLGGEYLLELLNSSPIDIIDSKLVFNGQIIDFGLIGSANTDANIVNSLLIGQNAETCSPMLKGSNNTNLKLRNVTIISDGSLCAPGTPAFFGRATQIDIASGTLDIANTALVYDNPRRNVPQLFLGPGVTLLNRGNNFVTRPESAAVLGGDTKSGVAGMVDEAGCRVQITQSNTYCVPAVGGQLHNMGNNAQAVNPRNNQPLLVDLAQRPRIVEGVVDIGAFEQQNLACPNPPVVGAPAGCPQPCQVICPDNVVVGVPVGETSTTVDYSQPTTTGGCGPLVCTPPSGSIFNVGTTTVTCRAPDVGSCSSAYGLTFNNRLVTFNVNAPGAVSAQLVILGLGAGENVVGIDVRPANGMLYGVAVSGSTARLLLINPTTGATTQIGGAFSVSGVQFGIDFNPVADRLRLVSNDNINLRINPDTGAVTTDTPLNPDPDNLSVVGSAYTNNFAGAPSTTLYGINVENDTLVLQGSIDGTPTSPNTGQITTVGGLGALTRGAEVGFDISECTGTAYAVFATGTGSTALYTVDLATGQATLVGGIGGSFLTGFTLQLAAPAQEPSCSFTVAVDTFGFSITDPEACTEPGNTVIGAITITNNSPTPASVEAIVFLPTGLSAVAGSASANVGTAVIAPDLQSIDYTATLAPGQFAIVTFSAQVGAVPVGTVLSSVLGVSVNGGPFSAVFDELTVSDCAQACTITCPTNIIVENDLGDCSAPVDFAPTLSGGCGDIVCSPPSGSTFAVGTTNVTCRAPNAGSCSTAYGLTTGNTLVSFNINAPGTLSTPVPIQSLAAGENVVGIDFRPANATLYGVAVASNGTTARLLTINPADGATTQVGATFTVSGTSFGVDFNPMADRLRLVSDTDINLSINPTDGVATAQTALNPGTPTVVGSAYTNNFAGATSTTLYGIDSGTDTLVIQNPPASGALTTVGSLGVNTTGSVGFDISQCTNTAYATLTTTTTSSLYAINLTTGTATLIGQLGGGVELRGFALTLTPAASQTMCSFTVTVQDTEEPIVACLPDLVRITAPGQCSATVTYATPTATDNCAGVGTPVCMPQSGSIFPVGATVVTCTVADASPNSPDASCSFTVTVQDAQAPTITCPANVIVGSSSASGATVSYPAPTVSDNCPGATVVCTPPSGSNFPLGATTVNCTADDASPNSADATCSFVVTVNPITFSVTDPLDCTAAGDVVIGAFTITNTGSAAVQVTASIPLPTGLTGVTGSGTANVGTVSVSTTAVNFNAPVFGAGATAVVTYRAQIGAAVTPGTVLSSVLTLSFNGGPASSSTDDITVQDCALTCTFTCPANITAVPNTPGQCGATVTFAAPTTNGGCGEISCIPPSGSTFNVGTTTVNCRAPNAGSCSTAYGLTTTNALISFNISAPNATAAPVAIGGLGAGENVVGIDFRPANGTLYGVAVLGTTARLLTINPMTGATAQVGATFTVSGTSFGVDFNPMADRLRLVSDTNINLSINPNDGVATTQTALNPGTPTVVGSAYTNNAAGATSTTLYGIDAGVDTLVIQNPPASGTLTTIGGLGVPTTGSVGFDISQCTGTAYATLTTTTTSSLYNINLTTGTATLIGAIGSGVELRGFALALTSPTTQTMCSFTVTVLDTQAPTIACPTNIIQPTAPGQCNAVVNYAAPVVSDNCPGVGAPLCTPPSGSTFALGTTTVNCTVADASADSPNAACSFTVTVEDRQSPTIACPADITQPAAAGQCNAVVTYATPTATDNCSSVTVMCTPPSGSTFAVGTTTVTCTARDTSANSADTSCSFTVTVQDTQAPTITCPTSFTVSADAPTGRPVTFPAPTVSDNCPGVGTPVCTPASGANFPLGTTTVNCTVADASPNSPDAACSFTITVNPVASTAVGPGAPFLPTSEVSDQKAGSVLFYNLYSSSAASPNTQNTRLSITNINPTLDIAVRLFFVDGATCSVADALICLTKNQTATFLASDLDPGTTGYLVAVASDLTTGCPVNFNFLIGDEYVKLSSGHQANLGAEAFAALTGRPVACDGNSLTAQLNFDGVSYNRVPRTLAASSIPARNDGNDTVLVLNRFGGNLATGASTLTDLVGNFYDDAENALSFTFSPGLCQFRSSLSSNFPRTTPRLETFIPAGRSGWLRLSSASDQGLLGAVLNYNPNAGASAGAFNQGRNLHKLTLTSTQTLIVPIFPPNCLD